MKATEIKQKEHILAEKARAIYEHQRELEALETDKNRIRDEKPSTHKERLSYAESLEFGKKLEQYKQDLKELDIQIQKLRRELNALELQAKKLLPAPEIKIRVSTCPSEESKQQTYSIQYYENEHSLTQAHQFEVEPIND